MKYMYILKVPCEEKYFYDFDFNFEGITEITNTTERKMARYFETKEEIEGIFDIVKNDEILFEYEVIEVITNKGE